MRFGLRHKERQHSLSPEKPVMRVYASHTPKKLPPFPDGTPVKLRLRPAGHPSHEELTDKAPVFGTSPSQYPTPRREPQQPANALKGDSRSASLIPTSAIISQISAVSTESLFASSVVSSMTSPSTDAPAVVYPSTVESSSEVATSEHATTDQLGTLIPELDDLVISKQHGEFRSNDGSNTPPEITSSVGPGSRLSLRTVSARNACTYIPNPRFLSSDEDGPYVLVRLEPWRSILFGKRAPACTLYSQWLRQGNYGDIMKSPGLFGSPDSILRDTRIKKMFYGIRSLTKYAVFRIDTEAQKFFADAQEEWAQTTMIISRYHSEANEWASRVVPADEASSSNGRDEEVD
ncbi:hypothetical protein HGRIS_014832 [Hohenbuehelia grisea]|uniref:Uncharacterized protein n=1 Tax=Hohenbuehelia grisea TaxID=104357 RepID=A0ABR3IQV2_9AGAR